MADPDTTDPRAEGPRAKKQKTGGFKWKDKKSVESADSRDRPATGLQRGYRDRSPRRESYRDRSPRRDDTRTRSPQREQHGARSPRKDDYRDRQPVDDDPRSYSRTHDRDRQRERSPGYDDDRSKNRPSARDSEPDKITSSTAEKFGLPTAKSDKKDKSKRPPKSSVPSEPMIIVNVNDRLGTKAAIPCLASDSVKAFKAIVAAHIGRQPHEIMLKRQGERPFKDQLSLEDYGVSSGIQLDLEIDTGD